MNHVRDFIPVDRTLPAERVRSFFRQLSDWLLPDLPEDLATTLAPLSGCGPRRPPARVLVADDNPANLQDACELLARQGIRTLMAADGAEAVALACGNEVDLVLMDLHMPVLDGMAATMQIRQHERYHALPRVPVVAYVASSFGLPGALLSSFGIDAVLEKPCSERTLLDCLARWCPPRRGRPAADLRS
jgi:CheY-like chemotaxis protein